jgi:hypothetical protein
VTDDSTIPPGRHSDASGGDIPTGDDTGAGAGSPEASAARSGGDTSAAAAGTPAGAGRTRTDRVRGARMASPDAERAKRRRRRLIIGGIAAGSALVILLVCLGFGALLRLGFRAADAADESGDRSARADRACQDLETRLNRLVPPGATGGDPGRRAAAIRDENAAVRPFLAELEASDGDGRDRDRDHGWGGDDSREWLASWRQLIETRELYANALDRQVTAGEPAFFVAPKDDRGRSVVETLEQGSRDSCLGSIRRLARPDL